MFSTNEIELIEAGDLQVIHDSDEGSYRRLGAQHLYWGEGPHRVQAGCGPGLYVKKALKQCESKMRSINVR